MLASDLPAQTAKPFVPIDPPRGKRWRGRGNAIRQAWCGPQAQPRTRSCLLGLPEGEGNAFTTMVRGVWLVQIPLAPNKPMADVTTM